MDGLIEILLDKNASISERDDAAMDLSEYDEALEILIRVGSDEMENPIILSSCGTSISEIWRRRDIFEQNVVDALAPQARSEIKAAFS